MSELEYKEYKIYYIMYVEMNNQDRRPKGFRLYIMAKEYAKKFYNSIEWQSCRQGYIAHRISKDGGICEHCGESLGYIVHHKDEITSTNIHDPTITLNHENLEYVCKGCHDDMHGNAFAGTAMEHNFSADGQPIPKAKVIIVYGAPASGKTRWVENNKDPGDMVLDLDEIRRACHGSLRDALNKRDELYANIQTGKITGKIYVIETAARKNRREYLKHKLNGELVFIKSTKQDCLNRAMADPNRHDKQTQRYIIEKWFKEYEND